MHIKYIFICVQDNYKHETSILMYLYMILHVTAIAIHACVRFISTNISNLFMYTFILLFYTFVFVICSLILH